MTGCYFTRHDDGRVTVTDWYREQWFSAPLLLLALIEGTAKPHFDYDTEADKLTITVDNGRAVYQLSERNVEAIAIKGLLIEAELDIPQDR